MKGERKMKIERKTWKKLIEMYITGQEKEAIKKEAKRCGYNMAGLITAYVLREKMGY